MKDKTILANKVIKSLNAIENACVETAKSWDKKSTSIPIPLFAEIITKSKWEEHPSNEIANAYIGNYNKMIDLLETAAIKSANSFSTDAINLNYISESIKTLKESFINGTKQK